MSIVLIVIYCLIAAVLIFGLTFSQELQEDKQRQQKRSASVISINAGNRRAAKLHRRA
jgi:hypothetical protein